MLLEEMKVPERSEAVCVPCYMPRKVMDRSLARAMGSDVKPQINIRQRTKKSRPTEEVHIDGQSQCIGAGTVAGLKYHFGVRGRHQCGEVHLHVWGRYSGIR